MIQDDLKLRRHQKALKTLVEACYQLEQNSEECFYNDQLSEVAPSELWAEFREALENTTLLLNISSEAVHSAIDKFGDSLGIDQE